MCSFSDTGIVRLLVDHLRMSSTMVSEHNCRIKIISVVLIALCAFLRAACFGVSFD